DIRKSIIGLGFEKLDRDVFDPEKSYEYVAKSGVKWARLQSGWQRTEQKKGVYDFSWLDRIVNRMLTIGVEPWLCLCYGNSLYTESAKKVFGAVGCPPIKTEEEKAAWAAYVQATVAHFKGRIRYYEIWNEPDGVWCWKHGPNAKELGEFIIATAKACKAADATCNVVGFVTCMGQADFVEAVAQTGCLDNLDAVSYHAYSIHEEGFQQNYRVYRDLLHRHGKRIPIIQGESGTQSRPDGAGALAGGAWTPLKQAKFLLRHLLCDIHNQVAIASYFSCMDMIEALNGTVGDVRSYLDYGYFGVIGADFDNNGRSTGAYTPKLSYFALQHLCSVFCEDYEIVDFPIERLIHASKPLLANDFDFDKTYHFGVRKPNGSSALVYWIPKDILTETIETTVSLRIKTGTDSGDVRLLDLLTGEIYALPKEMSSIGDDGYLTLENLPAVDRPLVLTIGDFYLA
ncbi:MAG: beta-galactosidase, partial [Kiritimatiellia bacterium]